jgi:tetratricopeptide (TPR) repeat protein
MKKNFFRIATVVLMPLLVIALLEGALSLLGVATTYEEEDPFVGFSTVDPLFAKQEKNGEAIYLTRHSKLHFFNEQEFKATKPQHGCRIFCLGGSTTFGRPYFYKTAFPAWLQLILKDLDTSKEYEVINAGGVSYASYRLVNLMNELVNYQPDMFIVYTGQNEFLEDRTYENLAHESPFIRRLRENLNQLRTYSLLRKVWLNVSGRQARDGEKKFHMAGEVNAILDRSFGLDQYTRDDARERAVQEHFEINLHRMVAISKSHGIQLMFIVPPSNEKDFSPFKSEFSRALTAQELQRWKDAYRNARAALARHEYATALTSLQLAADIDSAYAEVRFQMGQCLLNLGRFDEAKKEFDFARDTDVAPLRSTTAIQQIVRDVGRSENVPMVDLTSILETKCKQMFGHSILGNEFFLDHVHPTIAVHQLIAEELAKAMVAHYVISPQRKLQDLPLATDYDSVLSTIDSNYYALRDLNLAKVLEWAGKRDEAAPHIMRAVQQMPNHPEAHSMLAALYQQTGRLQESADEYRRSLMLDSTNAETYNGLSVVLQMSGQFDEAVRVLQKALKLEPENDRSYYALGNALYRTGHTQGAINAYTRAIDLNPRHSRAMNNLGLLYFQQGDLVNASRYLQKTIALEPLNGSAHNYLGLAYFQQGHLDMAGAAFRKTLESAPDDAFASQWLTHLQQQRN